MARSICAPPYSDEATPQIWPRKFNQPVTLKSINIHSLRQNNCLGTSRFPYQLIDGTQSCGASLEIVKYLSLRVSGCRSERTVTLTGLQRSDRRIQAQQPKAAAGLISLCTHAAQRIVISDYLRQYTCTRLPKQANTIPPRCFLPPREDRTWWS